MLQARVNLDNSPVKVVNAFAGREFVTNEWRPVPEGAEEEALNHPYLDVRELESTITIKSFDPADDADPADNQGREDILDLPADISDKYTVKELQVFAEAAGIEGYRTMRKAELLEALGADEEE